MTGFLHSFSSHLDKAYKIFISFVIIASVIGSVNYYYKWNYKPGKYRSNIEKYIKTEYGVEVKGGNLVVGAFIGAQMRAVWFIGKKHGQTDVYFIPIRLSSGQVPLESAEPVNVSNTSGWDEMTMSVYQDTVAFFNGESIITARPLMEKQSISGSIYYLFKSGIWKIIIAKQYTPDEKWIENYRMKSRNILQVLTCDNLKKCLISIDLSNSLASESRQIIESGAFKFRKKLTAFFQIFARRNP
ncbi:hypothetical protein KKF34_01495 [Myxococcota bacterium]|nr:hypothetical protein [Myxococcota bacterium]MBU1495532.1 hypothetical protein [Myxococcota bacterium]